MAIYHLNARHCQRTKGQSAAAKFDYLTRQGRYEKQDDCVYWSSGNLPEWASADPRRYWAAADQFERANASLGKEVEVALPVEMNLESQVVLTLTFTQGLTQGKHPYTFAIHEGNGQNPHAHIFISERSNDGVERTREQHFRRANSAKPERGGAPKNRDFQKRAWLEEARADWAERTNDLLEREGWAARIDHRSFEAQGILGVPTQHLGPKVMSQERRGVATERVDRLVAVADEVEKLLAEHKELERARERHQAQRTRDHDRDLGH